jgi:AMP deaminase
MINGVMIVSKMSDTISSADLNKVTIDIGDPTTTTTDNIKNMNLNNSLPHDSLNQSNRSSLSSNESYQDIFENSLFSVPSYEEYVNDFNTLRSIVYAGQNVSYSFKRLELLNAKFNLHVLLNEVRENDASKSVPHRDFYNVRKVDTHVHHSACMNQKHLLRFIKHKLRYTPHEVVTYRDGRYLTLGEVFQSLHLTAYDLSIDTLDMHANNTFHRFDRYLIILKFHLNTILKYTYLFISN